MSSKRIVITLVVLVLAGVVVSPPTTATPLPQNTPPVWCTPYSADSSAFSFGQNLMLATTHDNGLFKATDQGWKKLSPPTTVDIGVDPEGTIYLLGPLQDGTQPAPVYRSTDGGATWSQRGEGWFDNISPSPKPDWVFATLVYNDPRGGIYKSTDGGATWKQVSLQRASPVAFSPAFAQDGIAFAIAGGAILKTDTWGETWSPWSPWSEQQARDGRKRGEDVVRPQMPWNFGWVVVSPQFPQDRTAFAGGGILGVYKSTDGGDSWFKVADSGPPAFSPHYFYDHTLLSGGDGIYLSHDGGLTWQQVGDGYVYAVGIRQQGPFGIPAVAPNPLPGPYFLYLPFVGRESGALEFWVVRAWEQFGNCYLYRSRDEGATWQEVAVFEASHWHYLPLVTQDSNPG